MKALLRWCRTLHRDERAGAMEYVLVLAVVVLPLGLMWPLFHRMVRTYGYWFVDVVRLPFP